MLNPFPFYIQQQIQTEMVYLLRCVYLKKLAHKKTSQFPTKPFRTSPMNNNLNRNMFKTFLKTMPGT